MSPRIKGNHAMALLFDAMMFLTIIIVISMTLSSLVVSNDAEDTRLEYLQDVHSTMFSVTCDWCRDGGIAPVTIGEALMLGPDDAHKEILECQLRSLLSAYLDGRYGYALEIKTSGWELRIGEEDLSTRDVLASSMDLGTDVQTILYGW